MPSFEWRQVVRRERCKAAGLDFAQIEARTRAMFDFLSDFVALAEKPSRRFRWLNWIVWGFALAAIVITVAYYGLLASNYLTGWPPA